MTLHVDDVVERAHALTDVADPDPTHFRDNLGAVVDSMNSDAALTPVGVDVAMAQLVPALRNRIEVDACLHAEPGIGASVVDAPMHRTALTMAAAGLALALVSLLLGSLVAGRISRAVQQLGVASAAFASGFPVPLPTSKLTELRDVAQAMQVSADRARRREAAREAQPQI